MTTFFSADYHLGHDINPYLLNIDIGDLCHVKKGITSSM